MHVLLKELLFTEDFKTQAKKFEAGGVAKNIVKHYIDTFKKIRDSKYKVARDADIEGLEVPKGNDRFDIDKYKDFHQLEIFVDYVGGQISGMSQKGKKFTDVEVNAEPLGRKNGLEIYYAKDKRACIHYKGNRPYSWCIARNDASNMYNTYRYKPHEPSFYFVKDVAASKEEFSLPFDGEFRNPWHFFVIQKTKDGYIVTNANNDGDKEMDWDEIVEIQPKLKDMEQHFQHVPLTPREREQYEKFMHTHISDEQFAKMSYEDKEAYLDIAIPYNELTPKMFQSLPHELKNKYIGFGIHIGDKIYSQIKQDKNLLKRFFQISLRKYQEMKKDARISLNAAEYDVLYSSPDAKKIFNNAGSEDIEYAILGGVDLDVVAATIGANVVKTTLNRMRVDRFFNNTSRQNRKKYFKYVDKDEVSVPTISELFFSYGETVSKEKIDDALEFIATLRGADTLTISDAVGLVNMSIEEQRDYGFNKMLEYFNAGKIEFNGELSRIPLILTVFSYTGDIEYTIKMFGIRDFMLAAGDHQFDYTLNRAIRDNKNTIEATIRLLGKKFFNDRVPTVNLIRIMENQPIQDWQQIVNMVGPEKFKNLDKYTTERVLRNTNKDTLSYVVDLIGKESVNSLGGYEMENLINKSLRSSTESNAVTLEQWVRLFGYQLSKTLGSYTVHTLVKQKGYSNRSSREIAEVLFPYFSDNPHGYIFTTFLYYHPDINFVLSEFGPKLSNISGSEIYQILYDGLMRKGDENDVKDALERLARILPFTGTTLNQIDDNSFNELLYKAGYGYVNKIPFEIIKQIATRRTEYNETGVYAMLLHAIRLNNPQQLSEIGQLLGPENIKKVPDYLVRKMFLEDRVSKKLVYNFLLPYLGKEVLQKVLETARINLDDLTEHLNYKNYF